MPLTLLTNLATLMSQPNLGRTRSPLGGLPQELPAGLRIRRVADEPAAPAANASNAANAIQRTDGALAEASGLLSKLRGLRADGADGGARHPASLLDNEAQFLKALNSINAIVGTTRPVGTAAEGLNSPGNVNSANLASDYLRAIAAYAEQ
ncbi:MAG: hypothetical protein ACHQAY_00210 [Hyphomicrobiales bacterium]